MAGPACPLPRRHDHAQEQNGTHADFRDIGDIEPARRGRDRGGNVEKCDEGKQCRGEHKGPTRGRVLERKTNRHGHHGRAQDRNPERGTARRGMQKCQKRGGRGTVSRRESNRHGWIALSDDDPRHSREARHGIKQTELARAEHAGKEKLREEPGARASEPGARDERNGSAREAAWPPRQRFGKAWTGLHWFGFPVRAFGVRLVVPRSIAVPGGDRAA